MALYVFTLCMVLFIYLTVVFDLLPNKSHVYAKLYHQISGFIVGAVPWLKNLLIGDDAPFRVIQDSITLLGYNFSHSFLVRYLK